MIKVFPFSSLNKKKKKKQRNHECGIDTRMKANLIDFTFVYPDIQNCEKKEERL